MQSITQKQRQFLKKSAHSLKPTILIGAKGLTDAVLEEIDSTLEHHELIKIRISGADKPERSEIAQKIADQQKATLVHTIGHIITLYRAAKKPKISLPNI